MVKSIFICVLRRLSGLLRAVPVEGVVAALAADAVVAEVVVSAVALAADAVVAAVVAFAAVVAVVAQVVAETCFEVQACSHFPCLPHRYSPALYFVFAA